jgi:hypothetical protein
MIERHPREAVEIRLRMDPTVFGGALLILLQTVVRAGIVFPSYYWQDDFHHVELARRLGLSQAFLVRDYSGHLEVGQYFLYWLIGRDAGLSFVPAAVSLLVLQIPASCLLLAVLTLLFGRSPWILLPFAGYLFTPLGLPVATWWAAGLQAMPLQIAMLFTLLASIRAVRQRSWTWGALSVAGQAVGLVFWEKAVLILPAVLTVLVLVEWAGTPFGRRVRLLLAQWWLLLPHLVLLIAYAYVYLSVVDSASVLGQQTHDVAGTTSETVFRLLLPGLFGGPWTDAGGESTVFPRIGDAGAIFFAALLLTVIAASVWLRGTRALQGWLLVTGYVAVDLALLQIGRADFIGLLVRDPRYITDSLPIIAIGVCAAFSGPARSRPLPRWVPRTAGSGSYVVPGIAVLICSCLLSSFLLAEQLQHRYSRDYALTVVQALDANPGVSVLSTPLPTNVSISTDLPGLLRAVGREHELDQPGTDVRMVDGLANLRPVTVIDHSLEEVGPIRDCGWRVEGAWVPLGALPDRRGAQVVRVGYLTGQDATVHLKVAGYEQAVPVRSGLGYATFVVTGRHEQVSVRVTDVATGGICISDVVAGAPWPAE